MRLLIVAASVVLVTSVLTFGQAQDRVHEPSVELPEDLARVLTDYETAWRRGDEAALAQLFTEDGFALSPRTPPVLGAVGGSRNITPETAVRSCYGPSRMPPRGRSVTSSAATDIGMGRMSARSPSHCGGLLMDAG